MDRARRAPVAAKKRDAPQHPFGAKRLGQQLLVTQAILQGQHGGFGAQQGADQFDQSIVGKGFQADHHQIGFAHRRAVAKSGHPVEVKVPIRRRYVQATAGDGPVIAAQ